MVVAIILGCAALYALRKPEWAVVFILVLYPLEQLILATLPGLPRPTTNIVVGLVALFALQFKMARGERVFSGYFNTITLLIFALYVLQLLGLLWTPAIEDSLERLEQGWPYLCLFLVIAPLLITDLRDFRKQFPALMIAGSIVAVLIILSPRSSYQVGRFVVDIGVNTTQTSNPLALASMGGLMALVAVLSYSETKRGLLLVLRVIAFFCGMGLAISSGSRGQVLATLVAIVIAYPVARKVGNPKNFLLSALGLFITLGAFYLLFNTMTDQSRRWSSEGISEGVGERLNRIFGLMEHYTSSPEHWLFGLGTLANYELGKGYVHNMIAELLFEGGLVSAAIFTAAMVTALIWSRRLFLRFRDDPAMRATVGVLLAYCAFQGVLALKQGSIAFIPGPFMALFIFAKIAKQEQIAAAEEYEAWIAEHPDQMPDEFEYDEQLAEDYAMGNY